MGEKVASPAVYVLIVKEDDNPVGHPRPRYGNVQGNRVRVGAATELHQIWI